MVFKMHSGINFAVLVLTCLALAPVLAQKPSKSLSVAKEVVSVAIDRPGDLYVLMADGTITRVDADGNATAISEVRRTPSLFDPRDGSRLFAYYRDQQRFSYFSTSREMSSHPVDSAFAIEPWLVCPSGDYNVWIADAADNVIRKVNNTTSRIDAEIQFSDKVSTIRYMRDYQGFLFVLHPDRGIVIYSGMGKELRTIGNGSASYFNFLGEELYYPDNNQLTFFNLFNAETRTMKLPRKAAFSLVTDTRVFSVNGSSVEIFTTSR
jgi:hypothetical protein